MIFPDAMGRGDRGSLRSGWHVYMLRCADGSFYVGIAKDLDRRLAEHNGDNRLAARYTLGRRPVELVYVEPACNRSAAAKREHALKRLDRRAKEAMTHKG